MTTTDQRVAFSPPQRGEGARSADEGSSGGVTTTPHPPAAPSPLTRGEGRGRDYSDPYLAGAALGLVLLAAFAIAGRGLGASGAFATAAAGVTDAIAPARAADSALFARYLDAGGPWRDWLLFEIAGVILGGFLSALLAGRFRFAIERGRLGYAFFGGSLMGCGAVLARGCTSGLGLTGGALLSVGSWLFIAAAFAAGYAVAPLVRKAWS